ncbi:Cro/Cl family transcriptional regulator [Pseudomonas fluorescens]|uniref:Cro/Cl family transcriptional regulator n=1 Tax=Pseudomonas fluorescens TaxID=294 RepID=A0A1T2Y3S3_PSEFL|nr:AAA family ATPase [Pseudomonas fluorescens]OPA86747.1 Cro/Cl family transcriptional regulator [Pseudomonas fluorescens]
MDAKQTTFAVLPQQAPTVSDGRVLLDAALLKGLRKQRGLSQETLAEACLNRHLCVSIASIKRAETGKPVLYRTARHLATAFQIDVEALLGHSATRALVEVEQSMTELHNTVLAAQSLRQFDDDVIRYVLQLSFEMEAPGAPVSPEQQASRVAEIERLIRQFGGVPMAREGGIVVARFGAPQAYRSDSERALLCALALSREQFARPDQGIVLQLVRNNEEASAMGEALRQLREHNRRDPHGNAPVNVAQGLVEQLRVRFEFSQADEPFPAYRQCLRLRHLDENASRPLVGRTVEVQQFKAVIEATQAYQDGHAVYVRGMAGIGKTRLVTEFFEMARQGGFACHRSDVLDFGMDNALWPLGQLVRSLLGLDSPRQSAAPEWERGMLHLKLADEHQLFLRVLTGVHRADEPPRHSLAQYAAMSSEVRTQGLLSALLQLLRRLAVHQPLLICIEDLHWADVALCALLGKLLEATDEVPVVWLLTSRHEGDPLQSALRPYSSNPMSLLDIAPIRAREASLLADQFSEVDPAYRADCVKRAQGSPLYLTQLLSSREGVFPDSLRHLIQTRFDRLQPEHRHALRYAAIFGNRCELALWREALGQPKYRPGTDMCEGLLRETEPGRYLFVHDLVMHCLYDAMPDALREQLHREVAKLYRERDRSLYAQHLLLAKDPAAFDAVLLAMEERLQACQYDSVLALGLQAAAFVERAAGSFTLALRCGQAHCGLGEIARAREFFQSALALAEQPQERIEAALELAPVLNTLDCLEEEEHLIEQILPGAQALQAHTALARLYQLRGDIYFPRGDYAECRRLHEESLSYSRIAANLETEAKALGGIGDSYYAQGRMQTAYEVFDQCVRVCERHGLSHVEAGNRSARGSTLFYLGQPEQALRDAMDAAGSSRQIGNRRAEVFSRLTAAWVLVATGRDEQAGEELAEALTVARSIGASRFEAILLEGLARVALRQNERDRAHVLIQEAVGLVERFALQRYIGPWIYGSLALIVDDAALSAQALVQGEALLTQDCLAHNALRFRVAAAETCLLSGDFAQASRHAQGLAAVASAAPCAWVSHHVRLIEVASRCLQNRDGSPAEQMKVLERESARLGFLATMPRLMQRLSLTGERDRH